jgi:hypothetical protein|tara:strand:- start:230 stop:922 length:693 start_codon:yes stop_codon:yes gene_type:complete
MEILHTKDIKDPKVDALVYGRAGTGKTLLGSTFPKPIFVDTDNGLLSLRKKDVSFISCHRSDGAVWWNSIREATKLAIASKDHDSIVIDSFPLVCEAMLLSICSQNRKSKPTFDEWVALWNGTQEYIAMVRASPKNSLFICGEQFERDENSGKVWCLPALQGQARTKVDHLFDEIYHAEAAMASGKPAKYSLLIRPDGISTAKSRALPATSDINSIEPHFMNIKNLISGR